MSKVRRDGRSPLRVLMVVTTIEPEVGGPSYVVVNAVEAERRAGMLTDVASTIPAAGAPESGLRSRLGSTGARHYEFKRPRRAAELTKRWGVSPGLARWLVRNARRYDVIHAHYVWSFGTVAALVSGALWQVPVVLTPHESLTEFGIETSRSPRRRRQKIWVRDALLRRIKAVLVSSELERVDSALPEHLVRVVPHPVPPGTPPTTRGADETTRRRNTGFVLGYLGRLHEKKRVEALITAFVRLPANARLRLAGDEPRERLASLRELADRLGVAARVEFLGFIDETERDAFFTSVDVLAMPSAYECFGMVAAEAMTVGLPVVVSSRSGVAAAVTAANAGLVVSPERDDELADALIALSQDEKEREDMGSRARRAAVSEFSYAAYAGRTAAIYQQVSRR